MDLSSKDRKYIGAVGEKVAAEYLQRHGFTIRDRNIARKTGELDVIAEKDNTLHFVEVKTMLTDDFPYSDQFPAANRTTEAMGGYSDSYDPSMNLHAAKIQKVVRTGEWYVIENEWEGDWQVDGCLVWLRKRDGMARVSYLPQIA